MLQVHEKFKNMRILIGVHLFCYGNTYRSVMEGAMEDDSSQGGYNADSPMNMLE